MAVVFQDEFVGAAGSVVGRVVDGHAWAATDQDPVLLSGSGTVLPDAADNRQAMLDVPELDAGSGAFDLEMELGTVASMTGIASILIGSGESSDLGPGALDLEVSATSVYLAVGGAGSDSAAIAATSGMRVRLRFELGSSALFVFVNDVLAITKDAIDPVAFTDAHLFLTLGFGSGYALDAVSLQTAQPVAFWTSLQRAIEVA